MVLNKEEMDAVIQHTSELEELGITEDGGYQIEIYWQPKQRLWLRVCWYAVAFLLGMTAGILAERMWGIG